MAMPTSAVAFKKNLLRLLLALLVLPAVQAKWHLVPIAPLHGYDQTHAHPVFSWRKLLNNKFQGQLDSYLTDRLGFREFPIRLYNQLDYSLFGVIHAVDIVEGQHGVLFQRSPLGSYLGQDYRGVGEIAQHAQRTRDVQDSLARHGVQFLYVLAPGKAEFQPEDLPANVQSTWGGGTTNYAALAQALPAAGVHVLDAAALFQQWKPTAQYPLFPRGGIHWSVYGITLVADTLFQTVAHLTGLTLPTYRTTRPGTVTANPDSLRHTDSDIADGLNLLQRLQPTRMAYPSVRFYPPAAGQRRPNTLLITDSFGQSFYGAYPYLDHLLDARSRLWSYNKYVYWPEDLPNESHSVHELNLRRQVESRQLVIIVSTTQNLYRLGFGFIDEVYALYHPAR